MSLGVVLRPTVENIARDYEENGDDSDLVHLWEAGCWDLLAELARFSVTGSRKPPGAFARAFGKKTENRNRPAFVLLGAALFEQGDVEPGLATVHEYMERYAPGWTLNYAGIGHYYLALEALARDDGDEALQRLHESWASLESPRVADRIEELTGERPVRDDDTVMVGQQFPRYDLERLEDRQQRVSLEATLRKLPPGKLLAVCLLGSYRVNGPYNEFMLRYRGISAFFEPYIHELHVITANPQKVPEEYDYMLNGERKFQEFEDPFEILLDREDAVDEEAGASYSPCILLVDGQGTIVYRGDLGPIDLWKVMAARYRT